MRVTLVTPMLLALAVQMTVKKGFNRLREDSDSLMQLFRAALRCLC